jgi:acetyl-CoA carboxylase biotin carboxylase subunit
MFAKVLVANRGAVAARILRALRQLKIASVAVYSEPDRDAPYLAEADQAAFIGAGPARESYLDQERLLEVLHRFGADAVHPGYGFLAENATFAERIQQAGATFIGPSPTWLSTMGHKTAARELMQRHGMPVGRGSGVLPLELDRVLAIARSIGFPVLVKPAGGGGGIGMLTVNDEAGLLKALDRARSMAQRSFGTDDVYLERLLLRPRHIEFQILGDRHGAVEHLFERDCSIQRRHQKVIEEAPAPNVDRASVDALAQRTAAILRTLGYDNIGTVETMLAEDGEFSFLEMNTRLQVEHAVTEAITGVDLVQAQIRLAAGRHLATVLPVPLTRSGHAIEARVCAEDPVTFFPSAGTLTTFRPPEAEGLRVETGYREGSEITPYYDSMIAKVIAHAPSRPLAIARLSEAMEAFAIAGVKTNIPFIRRVLQSDAFQSGLVHTGVSAGLVTSL